MNCIRSWLVWAALAIPLFGSPAAEEKKEEKKPEVPKVTGAFPFLLSAGATNRFIVRGINLTNATALRFPAAEKLSPEVRARGKATVPEKADAKKIGDTQLELELLLPEDFPLGDLPFFVSTPDGDTNTNLLQVVARTLLLEEKEPNGGFRKFNLVKIPQTIRGTIDPANDVDVFQFPGKAGLKVRVESLSARHGSSLDPIVTLYDATGHTLSTSDDAKGSTDALLQYSLPKDGNYFLTVVDAHDRGGSSYSYALVIRAE